MPDSPTSEPESTFVCDCEEYLRSCANEPFYKEHETKRYCVLHFPSKEKSRDFEKALHRKLANKDFDFRGVWFPDELVSVFVFVEFSAPADFSMATFSAVPHFFGATFSAAARFTAAIFDAEADFRGVAFRDGAHFDHAKFRAAAHFSGVTFSTVANFGSAIFNAEADFHGAQFRAGADFSDVSFNAAADFGKASFADYVRFARDGGRAVFGNASTLDLQFARAEQPDYISFHTTVLEPNWFVNVDAQKFEFTNVDWNWRSIGEEIESLESKNVSSPHRLLARACRHLAVNAEENHRYEEASNFRYVAMDAQRRARWRGFAFWRLSWWYWLASGYGERVSQAFLVLLGIWFVAGLLYTRVGFARWEPRIASESDVSIAKRDDVGVPLRFSRALAYSAGVMTLQKPEPRPATTAAQTVVLLETVLGPVQAALLALAIRRKFMR